MHPSSTLAREGADPRLFVSGPDPFPRLPVTLQPDPSLFKYYALVSLVAGPFFFISIHQVRNLRL